MQKNIRINESQILYLSSKARSENTLSGHLYKKSVDTGKWQQRWFALYQNLLFYYENDACPKPSGMALLEGCYCERVITSISAKGKDCEKQNCFAIYYRKEGQRQYELRTETESECTIWIDAILQASFSKVLEQKEQLEQKHLHLLQILDSERQAKWHYVQQTEELTAEVKKLKNEIREYKTERRISSEIVDDENEEIKKIKKVQSFFRGWLCRRRWKQIVELYIRSEHAESMRRRNSAVFSLVECEEEYVKQLSTLVSVFLRPFRMAASSKNPPVTHEDVNSIFLNSETLLFLHQIFLKGLMARMENWPTLVLVEIKSNWEDQPFVYSKRSIDLFDMLLPMLGIYQEYVRNHHYSLQVLAEYKQKPDFNQLLRRYEEKSICEGHSLATFLTYPMHQVPRYIVTIHELLAHTPHDHVERKSLEFALSKLEEISQVMQDEVSETENIRKNLAIERMIVEGCDILLDVNQTFVRQGTLIQVILDKGRSALGRLGSFSSSFKETRKETVRQVFLFTYHLLLTTRSSNGRLHLAKHYGKIPLVDCTLLEDSNSEVINFDDDASSYDSSLSLASQNSGASLLQSSEKESRIDYNGLDFRITMDSRSGPPITITLVASTVQEKAAWCSDIAQCIENLHYSDIVNNSLSETSSVVMPQSVRSDPKLYRDDIDIKFSRSLNSCKVPQIRHATVDRLLDRLTDLRFMSVDFLNTFLITYRVFTTGPTIVEALRRIYRNPEFGNLELAQQICTNISHRQSFDNEESSVSLSPPPLVGQIDFTRASDSRHLKKPQAEKLRRVSTGSMRIEVTGEKSPLSARLSDGGTQSGFRKYEREEVCISCSVDAHQATLLMLPKPKLAPIASCETLSESFDQLVGSSNESLDSSPVGSSDDSYTPAATIMITTSTDSAFSSETSPLNRSQLSPRTSIIVNDATDDELLSDESCNFRNLMVPSCLASGSSSETLLSSSFSSSHLLSTATSSDTLVPSSPRSIMNSPQCPSPKRSIVSSLWVGFRSRKVSSPSIRIPTSTQLDALALSPAASPKFGRSPSPLRRATSPCTFTLSQPSPTVTRRATSPNPLRSPVCSPKLTRAPSPISYSYSSPNIITNFIKPRSGRLGCAELDLSGCSFSPRSSFTTTMEGSSPTAKAGAVVTSSRASKRRSSSTAATAAFAAATAGSTNPGNTKELSKCNTNRHYSTGVGDLKPSYGSYRKRESAISSAATVRVLNILRQWVTKHSQDFELDPELKASVKDLLDEIMSNPCLLPAEHKLASTIACAIIKEEETIKPVANLELLLMPPEVPTKDTFDSLSALDIAEQLTYLDHQIFVAISSEELLGQAWMKPDKVVRAAHVLLVSKRFNEASRLVVSEIVHRQTVQERVICIEKWAAIADICRCMHNYNGVLQICAAFLNCSVYRLRKTWEKISKQTKQMIERLQLLVSSDGRFKNMRDALHSSDLPCIPYLGMYLTDLSFIEEGTSNLTEEGLINFSKMRMIAHVIREIQHFQQTPYRIEHHRRVTNYLLDPSRLLEEEQTFRCSLEIEPRSARPSVSGQTS